MPTWWTNWGGWRFKEAHKIPQDITWKLWLYPGGYKTSDHKARYQYEESHWARAQARCYSPPFSWRSITCINSLTLQIGQVHSLTDYRWNLCGTMDCSAADILETSIRTWRVESYCWWVCYDCVFVCNLNVILLDFQSIYYRYYSLNSLMFYGVFYFYILVQFSTNYCETMDFKDTCMIYMI